MRLFRIGVTGAVLAALLFSGGVTAAGKPTPPRRQDAEHAALANPTLKFVPGEVVVRFEPGASAEARTAALATQGAKVQQNLPLPGLRLVKLPPGKDVHAAAAALTARPEVKYAEPNWIYYPAATTPNDPRFPQQWALNQANDQDIDAPEAWDITQGTHSTVVAVVDTGVAYDHNDLAPNIWSNPDETLDGLDNDGNGKVDDVRGWDVLDDDNDPFDTQGHGTHVAGIIGARGNNAIGVAGVNWDVSIMPVRVAGPTGTTEAKVMSGFAYAVGEGARVVNASYACSVFSQCSQALKDTIDAAPETLFVVPAGNWGGSESSNVTPCHYTSANLICVAATTKTDGLAPFSNYGTTSVDLGAPGTTITSTWLGYDTIFFDGFESPTLAPVWTSGGTNNTWATSTALSTGGARSATDSPDPPEYHQPYANNTDSWIRTTAATSFAGRSGCQVAFDVALEVIPPDSVEVEGATNPAGPWTSVDSLHTSTPRIFSAHESDMSMFDGQPSVYLRFRLHTDADAVGDGVWLDQVKIRCASTNYDADDYNTINGTSMAAAYVSGVAGLIFAKNPTATVAEARAALLETGDPLPELAGKTVTGRRVNAFNALSRFCGGKYATIVGTAAGETLTGTPGDDVIVGLGGNDTIDGGGGNDRICGGLGNDTLRGRLGNDIVAGDGGTDTLDYSLAPSAIVTNMASHGSSGGDGVDSFTGIENWTGSAFNDTLVADAGSNTILGGDGNDTLRGGLGSDTMNGGNGIDLADYNGSPAGVSVSLTAGTASGGAGNDSLTLFEGVVGSPFADTLVGDGGPNGLTGGAGVDTLWGRGGADRLRGGPDADTMHGEAGTDTLDYTTAPAGVTASLLGGTATGGAGADSFDGLEYVLGSPSGDNLTGSDVHNRLDGLGGNDSLFGLAGDDVLWGGIGTDDLDGGADTDKCLEGEVLVSCEL